MTVVIVIVGILVGLVAIMAIVGATLPQGHLAFVTARLRTPAGDVWRDIIDFQSWPSWNPSVKKVERKDERTWVMHDKQGKLPSEIVEQTPPDGGSAGRLVTRIADPSLPFGGTWTWEVRPEAQGENACMVSITEDGVVRNVVFRFMARFVFGYTGTMTAYLKALARKHGEDVTPTAHVESPAPT